MKIRLDVILKYISVLMLIFSSGTVIFNIKYNSIFIPFWCLVVLIANSFCGKRRGVAVLKNLETPIFLVVFIIFNTCFHVLDGVQLNGVFQLCFYILGTAIVCSFMSFKEYKKYFINCVFVMAIVAISVFCLALFGYLPYRAETINGHNYLITLGHVLGWDGSFFTTRVCGLFHEPGMFQIILNTAILYIADNMLEVRDFKGELGTLIKLLVLALGVFLTRSTSGYLAFALIMAVFFAMKRKTIKKNWLKILYILSIPLAVAVLIMLLNNEVIVDKFQSDNMSFSIRQNDLMIGLEIMKQAPIMGWGYMSEGFFNTFADYDLKSFSNGLIAYMDMSGIPLILFLIASVYCRKKNFRINILAVLLFYGIQNVTESCLFFPAILAFVFKFSEESPIIADPIETNKTLVLREE